MTKGASDAVGRQHVSIARASIIVQMGHMLAVHV
jgi:hypothetical protein